MAVTVGFEPTVGGYPTQLFESCTFGRSDTSPSSSLRHESGCREPSLVLPRRSVADGRLPPGSATICDVSTHRRTGSVAVSGYKTDASARSTATANLLAAAPRLAVTPGNRALMEASDDAFDAVVAALIARAHALGATHPVPPAALDRARREGWIALPSTPLAGLDPTRPAASPPE